MAILTTINLAIVVLVGIFTYFYLTIRKRNAFWAERGVPFDPPHLIFGSLTESAMKRIPMAMELDRLYKRFDGLRFGGVWQMTTPAIFLRDLDLIRDVLIKDFSSWPYRGVVVNEDVDPLSAHLAFLDGKKWKSVRAKLTPTFTSAKLKHMHYLVLECAKDFTKFLDGVAEKGEPVEAITMSPRFTIDVIGSCAFGIKMNSMSDEDAQFRSIGMRLTAATFRKQFVQFLQIAFPSVFRFFKVSLIQKDITEFFLNLTKETFEYREKNNVRRHDFLDLLRDLQNEGQALEEDEVVFDNRVLAAQVFVFFGAGFETSSKTISYCLHELAQHQDIQDRLREEIHEKLAKSNGEATWESLKSMKYLDMIIQETLRKYPIAPQTQRVSAKPYTVPGTDVVLPPRSLSIIPTYAIHHDPQYYPDPDKFIPERFTDEEKSKRHPCAYLPFGGGPRNCIGMRFADQETKVAIVTIVDKFRVSTCEKTQNEIRFTPKASLLVPEKGIWLKISRL